jgi:hypothetical protein
MPISPNDLNDLPPTFVQGMQNLANQESIPDLDLYDLFSTSWVGSSACQPAVQFDSSLPAAGRFNEGYEASLQLYNLENGFDFPYRGHEQPTPAPRGCDVGNVSTSSEFLQDLGHSLSAELCKRMASARSQQEVMGPNSSLTNIAVGFHASTCQQVQLRAEGQPPLQGMYCTNSLPAWLLAKTSWHV